MRPEALRGQPPDSDPATWAPTPRQAPSLDAHILGRWSPTRPSHITAGRRQLGAALRDSSRPDGAAEGGVERLLLAFEELISNAVRHGRSPIEVVVTATDQCWLLEVTDAAEGTAPIPDQERDAALGGLGLGLVAKVSGAHGWEPLDDGRKVVWARVDYTSEESAQFAY
jgi:anti-sigma regulatory factor (Ser/Thr protein kinase)